MSNVIMHIPMIPEEVALDNMVLGVGCLPSKGETEKWDNSLH